jgi:hypothetical protein
VRVVRVLLEVLLEGRRNRLAIEECEQLQYLVVAFLEAHFVELMLDVRELSAVILEQPQYRQRTAAQCLCELV